MENLRSLRKQKNLSLKEFAHLFGLGESTISQYENGNRQPSQELLRKFSAFFHVPIDYLLQEEAIEWKQQDLYEGFINAKKLGKDEWMIAIVKKHGIDPRIAVDYYAALERHTEKVKAGYLSDNQQLSDTPASTDVDDIKKDTPIIDERILKMITDDPDLLKIAEEVNSLPAEALQDLVEYTDFLIHKYNLKSDE